MALPGGDLLSVRLGGASGSDSWSIGFWFVLTGLSATPSPAAMNTAANNLLGGFNTSVWNTAGTPLKGKNSNANTLASSVANLYRAGVITATGVGAITPVAGTVTSGGNPLYTARVVTLLTALAGRSNRGRVYLPWTGQQVGSANGLWSSDSTVLNNIAGLLGPSSGAQSTGYFFGGSEVADLVVMSRRHAVANSVVQLRMDNKPDTQHGREGKIVPTVFDTATV